jgi:PAS domain S-box-containing protein
VAGAWILITDWLMFSLVTDPFWSAQLALGKGWCFVVVTTAVLFALLRSRFNEMEDALLRAEMRRHSVTESGCVAAITDAAEAKRLQEALRASEERFREVVETIDDVVWISDVDKSRVPYASRAFERIWGRPAGDAASSARQWLESIHPEDRERVTRAALTKQTDGTYDETYRVLRPDNTVRWVRDRAYPVRDASGATIRIAGIAEDVSDAKKMEEQFLPAQRLEAIGTLASGVAHDLNNILAPMFMIAPLLKPKLSDRSDIDMLTIVEQSAQRGANVVRQLLTFSRGIVGERGPLQVRHLVKEMVAIMRETFPREIGIAQSIPNNLAPVCGDATQLHQVLINLCVNARDAMPDGGRLTIEARNAELGEEDVRGRDGVEAGGYVVLTVKDTGHGISPEVRARIFEPFFTTKEIGKGTGLGLSTVLGIVKSHGGFITLESEVGRGSSFHVYLPSAELQQAAALTSAPEMAPTGHGELVLIVDDEPAVRQGTQHVLEKHGYRVLVAANGREGLGVFLLQRQRVRVVVTDLMMPEMGGVALARALRELSPDLAIVAATGLEGTEKREALAALGVTELLPKPYTPAQLLMALERELAKARD